MASVTLQPNDQTVEAERLDRVRALGDPVIDGAVPAYYTPGYEQHARDVQRFITGERAFVKKELGVDVPLWLAVLDRAQWAQIEKEYPYPVPSVDGTPPVALMPANWADARGFFAADTDVDPAVIKVVQARGKDWTQATYASADLIGGHELGHTVERAYGIVPGTHWLNELLASYVLYAYIKSQRHDLLWLLAITRAETQPNRAQPHVTLDDFEALYMQILARLPSNYNWYQGQFFDEVDKVYARKGVGFLKEVRAAFPPGGERFALGSSETLRQLEKISPGFIAWAHDVDRRPRVP
ncbi:MAG TPA: hypothetical protein VG222_17960 [Vicinamibacterales bacterium]|nr:hypothetical protein [Vicinamibacterales bacterium]